MSGDLGHFFSSAGGWFPELPDALRAGLVAGIQCQSMTGGSRVYHLGDLPNGLHAVVAGQVRLVHYPAPGQEQVDMVVKPGHWFGELSVLDGRERPHDAIAGVDARIASVAMPTIAALAAKFPDFWRSLALLHCRHHRLGMREAARVRALPAIARLAAFLAGQFDAAVVRTTQDELAQLVGISRQRLNVLLADLGARGLVATRYGSVNIIDRNGLRAIADNGGKGSALVRFDVLPY